MDAKGRLVAWLERQGVKVLLETPQPSSRGEAYLRQRRVTGTLQWAPFTSGLAINWARLIIVADPETPWPHILHEAGHLMATRDHPRECKEFEFLAWEYMAARKLRLPMAQWWEGNHDYGVEGQDLGDLPIGQRRKLMRELLAVAKKRSLLDEHGSPLMLRGPKATRRST